MVYILRPRNCIQEYQIDIPTNRKEHCNLIRELINKNQFCGNGDEKITYFMKGIYLTYHLIIRYYYENPYSIDKLIQKFIDKLETNIGDERLSPSQIHLLQEYLHNIRKFVE
jgi:hypothetical protein